VALGYHGCFGTLSGWPSRQPPDLGGSVILLNAMVRLSRLRRAHDYHRDLRTRLPAAAVAYPIDRARQFMTITSLSPSPNSAPVRRRYLTGTGHASPTTTVSAAFDRQNLEHRIPDHCGDRIHCGQN
jgi:hypothetical protein